MGAPLGERASEDTGAAAGLRLSPEEADTEGPIKDREPAEAPKGKEGNQEHGLEVREEGLQAERSAGRRSLQPSSWAGPGLPSAHQVWLQKVAGDPGKAKFSPRNRR